MLLGVLVVLGVLGVVGVVLGPFAVVIGICDAVAFSFWTLLPHKATRSENVASKNPAQAWSVKKYAQNHFCQFSVVLHKIEHECIMTLRGHFTKKTKKTKHGNVYNDRSTLKNGNLKRRFF